MRLLDRYTAEEVLAPLAFGATLFTVLYLAAAKLMEVANMISSQAAMVDVAQYLFLNLPQILMMSLPMAMLLACLMAYGRLSGEQEIVAMKAGGIGFLRIAAPALVLAACVSFAVFCLSWWVAPEANYRARFLREKIATRSNMTLAGNVTVQQNSTDGLNQYIHAHTFDLKSQMMKGVTIFYMRKDVLVRLIHAPEAVFVEPGYWKLYHGFFQSYDYKPDGKINTITSEFNESEWQFSKTPQDIQDTVRNAEEMTWGMLQGKIDEMRHVLDSHGDTGGYEADYRKDLRALEVSLYTKQAIPFTGLVFALFGIPLALRPQRTSTSIGLGLSLVFIVVYYMLMTVGMALGEGGSLPPALAAWMANIVFAGAGIALLVNASRH